MDDLAASLPPPEPLRQGLLIDYQWGETKFAVVALAAAIRTAPWPKDGPPSRRSAGRRLVHTLRSLVGAQADRDVTWLHMHAIQDRDMRPEGESGPIINVIVPAEYVTRAEPGPPFHRRGTNLTSAPLGIFPPDHPPPADALPLAQLQQAIAQLTDEAAR